MKKLRIIAKLDVKGPNVIKGIQFECLRVMGDPIKLAQEYYQQGADEIIYIDTVASLYQRNNFLNVVNQVSNNLFIPLTVGGGVRTIEDIAFLLKAGAEKVAINTAAVYNPQLIVEAVKRFGSQCIVASIDAKKLENDSWGVFTDKAREYSGKDVVKWAQEIEKLGAGEILLTSVDRDGKENGFDLDLIKAVTSVVSIPVIASGGAGKIEDFQICAKECNVAALATASLLHYKKCGIDEIKSGLQAAGLPIRRLLTAKRLPINYELESFEPHKFTFDHFHIRMQEEKAILSCGSFDEKEETVDFDIGIINCGINNSKSVVNGFLSLGKKVKLIKTPDEVYHAKALILPGVGTFNEGMIFLKKQGLIEPIKEQVKNGVPLLGICLGMQLLFTEGEEFGLHKGLDLITGKVVKFKSTREIQQKDYTLPHIGWNVVIPLSQVSEITNVFDIDQNVYYLHSYYPVSKDEDAEVLAKGIYGGQEFCSIIKKGNLLGTQFHPEKSGVVGLELIKKFCSTYNL